MILIVCVCVLSQGLGKCRRSRLSQSPCVQRGFCSVTLMLMPSCRRRPSRAWLTGLDVQEWSSPPPVCCQKVPSFTMPCTANLLWTDLHDSGCRRKEVEFRAGGHHDRNRHNRRNRQDHQNRQCCLLDLYL